MNAPLQDAAAAASGGRVLLLPGWQNSGPAHWQSRWQAQHGWTRVEQADWLWPRRGDWLARLDEALLEGDGGTLLVAHSLGCQLVASWSACSRHTARVSAALLVAPPDTERADTPPQLSGWRPIAREPLPFPSTVVASRDDPYCRFERSAEMARQWGSRLVDAGACGHVNGDSGLGDWPAGLRLLQELPKRLPAA